MVTIELNEKQLERIFAYTDSIRWSAEEPLHSNSDYEKGINTASKNDYRCVEKILLVLGLHERYEKYDKESIIEE